jgi:hypothetical protein
VTDGTAVVADDEDVDIKPTIFICAFDTRLDTEKRKMKKKNI